MSDNPISDQFERSFLDVPLEAQIRNCDHYELAPLFEKWLPSHQPVLEAGCGSGRWVAWFVRHGWRATGLDWSEALCARARKEIPGGEFIAGDMRKMPVPDGTFGSIVSLGALEHDVAGPRAGLEEYARVLRKGGIAIITVPHLGFVRRVTRGLKAALRPLLGKNPDARRYAHARTNQAWACDLMPDGTGWTFFQYIFTMQQMRAFFAASGFEVIEEFADFKNEGVLHNFGRIAGRYDHAAGRVVFTLAGRLLVAVLPPSCVGHMLCHVVRKK
jgi:SAM-dependent methyltransferase